jgi:hypothetical protein
MVWQPNQTVLVDANILVLMVVGATDASRLAAFARTKQYTPEDYELGALVLQRYRTAVTTPHILSQVSDLLRHSGAWGDFADELSLRLKSVYRTSIEHFVPARVLARPAGFPDFGLADCAVLDAAKRGCTVFTDDLNLHNWVLSNGWLSLNFTEVRFSEQYQ